MEPRNPQFLRIADSRRQSVACIIMNNGPTENGPHGSNSKKRHRMERRRLQRSHTAQAQPADSHAPSFWDNLSKVWLTKQALKELQRRIANQPSSRLQTHGLITQNSLAQAVLDTTEHSAIRTLEIKQFARRGGPDTSDLRGYPQPVQFLEHTMSPKQPGGSGKSTYSPPSRPTTAANTTNAKACGPYDGNFEQKLIDGGVFPFGYIYPDGKVPPKPKNWGEIIQRLANPRHSLSPSDFSEEAHEKFIQADAVARKEDQVSRTTFPVIEGEIVDVRCASGKIPFKNLDHLTDGNLVSGNPDIYYGARFEQLNQRVRDELNCKITPSTQADLPILPNFFVAVKGPDGSFAVAMRQATYDGALGERGICNLRSYGRNELDLDGNAHTITCTYHSGTLKLYTIYTSQAVGSDSRPQYYMHQIGAWAMTGDAETFRKGATAFRNLRDWAKEQRDAAIELANKAVDNVISERSDEEDKALPNTSSLRQKALKKRKYITMDKPARKRSTREITRQQE